jgi:hypothetical protein
MPAEFCDIIINIRVFESHIQKADRCEPWKLANGAENVIIMRVFLLRCYASIFLERLRETTKNFSQDSLC